jgi:GNAT superfamily N-acetyltransferase
VGPPRRGDLLVLRMAYLLACRLADRAKSVRDTLSDLAVRAWVADKDARVTGFVAATIRDQQRLLGEVVMLAVDPEDQSRGVGAALTNHATAWLRRSGMRVAVIGTGGDRGHAPARRVYEIHFPAHAEAAVHPHCRSWPCRPEPHPTTATMPIIAGSLDSGSLDRERS